MFETIITPLLAGAIGGGGLWGIFQLFLQNRMQERIESIKTDNQKSIEAVRAEHSKDIEHFKTQHALNLQKLEQSFSKDFFVFQKEQTKKENLEEIIHKYSGVMLLSAKDLQDRLWHLLVRQRKASNKVLLSEDETLPSSAKWPMSKMHYLQSSMYLFAQYFCWLEILRREIRYLNFGDDKLTNDFSRLVKIVERSLADTKLQDAAKVGVRTDFPVFQLMQSQIGEQLIKQHKNELTCTSFQDFCTDYANMKISSEGFRMLESLLIGSMDMAASNFCNTRLRILNNSLVDLIRFLNLHNRVADVEDAELLSMAAIVPSKREQLTGYAFLNSALKLRLGID